MAFLGLAKKNRGSRWVLRAEVVSELPQHRDETVTLICQQGGAEFVEHALYVGDGSNRCRKAPEAWCVKDSDRLPPPFCGQSVGVPCLLLKNGGEQCGRERMKV